ncbi:haloacid dehalogenase type II [Sphingomonas ginsenosidimutans]|jgi:2-haloacid dehalogenase|uniref:(S)-2-haloacid dehalogenase n=1 Tax=Sphingomonas ginsenosidimutans TaxID=862134 RepID=A0A2A4I214_9SPHN|nr:haloacid dehalogenase type II [Sphingomonas ginsenosidimutans]PCG09958.1 haloacid dehalogenase type II [Sphingomonas ginsenosidimutans]
MTRALPKVLAFDVFGTVVDWRGSVARESISFLAAIGRADVDPAQFADVWRMQYLRTMQDYAVSGRAFVPLDVLHREMLEAALRGIDVDPAVLDQELLTDWNRAWHRLDPWPDAVAGLTRLKARFPIVTLSNGNVALMLAMARRGGLPWDAILGAEVTGFYKPDPRAYEATARILDVAPADLCLVAAHHSDLAAARACGLATAFVGRPLEYGGREAPDAAARQDWDWVAGDFGELAERLGC